MTSRLTGGVSRTAANRKLADATASESNGAIYASVAEALQSAEVEVLVDYTSAAAVKDNVLTAIHAGVHVVVGSSGLTADDYAELDRLSRDRGVGIVAAGELLDHGRDLEATVVLAAHHLQHWEIVDYASADKRDVPSGTSRELAEML